MNFNSLAALYKTELFENVIPFWLNHSLDRECGGYFTCLGRTGNVYDTDKYLASGAGSLALFDAI